MKSSPREALLDRTLNGTPEDARLNQPGPTLKTSSRSCTPPSDEAPEFFSKTRVTPTRTDTVHRAPRERKSTFHIVQQKMYNLAVDLAPIEELTEANIELFNGWKMQTVGNLRAPSEAPGEIGEEIDPILLAEMQLQRQAQQNRD